MTECQYVKVHGDIITCNGVGQAQKPPQGSRIILADWKWHTMYTITHIRCHYGNPTRSDKSRGVESMTVPKRHRQLGFTGNKVLDGEDVLTSNPRLEQHKD